MPFEPRTYEPGPDALQFPPVELPYVALTLPADLQAQFDRLASRDLNDPDVLKLRRAIARRMHIPWISIHIDEQGVKKHEIQRGENFLLPREWMDRIQALSDGEVDGMRKDVARFIGLPLSHVEGVFDPRLRVQNFSRSLVPNAGEIADKQELVVPIDLRQHFLQTVWLLDHAARPLVRNHEWLLDRIFDRIASVYRLPRGRVRFAPVGAKCVYAAPFAGVLLRGSSDLATRIGEIIPQPEGPARQTRLKKLQHDVAHHFGVEYSELEFVSTTGGGFVFTPSEPQKFEFSVPSHLADRVSQLSQQVRILAGRLPDAELETALQHLQDQVAEYNGLESHEIERVTTNDGGFQFRLREARERPRRTARRSKSDLVISSLPEQKSSTRRNLPDSVSTSSIVGIVFGSTFCIILIFLLVTFIRKRRLINNT